MAIVYKHYKKDTKELFYIGIGLNEKRAYSKRSRNILWHNIVKKHNYYIEIHKDNISYLGAKNEEKKLISIYGRLDLNIGILCNMTDGGDGNIGMSKECRERISNKLKGKIQSEETILKKSKRLKEVWNNPKLKELKRQQTLKLWAEGKITGTLGIPSKKKGLPFQGDKNKVSLSLKEYYKTNKPHNFIELDIEIKNNIYKDYLSGINKFQLHKKYKLNRKVIDRILKEYYENK